MRYVAIGIIFLGFYSCKTDEDTKIIEGSADGSLSFRMYSPMVDNPQKEWSYSPKSTTVIGIPFTPKPVQVTFDGAIFTGNAELCFFYGQELKPTLTNQRHFYDGWIPIVMDDWEEDGIHYAIEMFGAQLEGEDSQNSIQFVKVTLQNRSEKKVKGRFAIAITASGIDHRYGGGTEDHENAQFDFSGNALLRNGKLVYLTSEDAQHYSVADTKFTGEYKGADFNVKKIPPQEFQFLIKCWLQMKKQH